VYPTTGSECPTTIEITFCGPPRRRAPLPFRTGAGQTAAAIGRAGWSAGSETRQTEAVMSRHGCPVHVTADLFGLNHLGSRPEVNR